MTRKRQYPLSTHETKQAPFHVLERALKVGHQWIDASPQAVTCWFEGHYEGSNEPAEDMV